MGPAACKIWYVICCCVLLFSQGFPLQAEYQSMVNVTSSAGPGLSPSMDYRTGCRNGPTQGLDWTPDYCGNGWADTVEIIQEYTQISVAAMLTCLYSPSTEPCRGTKACTWPDRHAQPHSPSRSQDQGSSSSQYSYSGPDCSGLTLD